MRLTDADLRAIADAHGTPAYLYDLDEVVQRVRALRQVLPERVDLAYAVKANPSPAVLAAIAGEGIGADVASGGELLAVERAGFDLREVVFTGPGKRDDELAAAVERPLRAITVESLGELERLRTIARAVGRRPRIMLRAAGEDRPGNVIGSGSGRFGMRPDDLARAALVAAAAPEVELVGLHRFTASNVLDAGVLLAEARRAVSLAGDLGVAVSVVDVGGGLGIPYRDDEPQLDLQALAAGLARLLDDLPVEARLLLEPGRHLVGPAGVMLVRVIDVKRSAHGALIATVDGGIHNLLAPALPGRQHRIRSLAAGRPEVDVLVGGPLCTALDVLGRVRMPEPSAGDLLVVADTGAYGFTQSMPLFLSHPLPAEIVLRDGSVRLSRPRISASALLDPGRLDGAAAAYLASAGERGR